MSLWDEALKAVGFPAADASLQLGSIGRQAELGRDAITMAGEQERQNIDDSWESRGMLRSGGRATDQVDQRGREAQRLAQLEAASADDIAGINLDLQRQIAQAQAQDAYQQSIDQLNDQQLARALDYANADAADIMASLSPGGGTDPLSSFLAYLDEMDGSRGKLEQKPEKPGRATAPPLDLSKFTASSVLGYG